MPLACSTSKYARPQFFARGDSLFEYRFSKAVIGRLRTLEALTILGNHEEIFLGAASERARSGREIERLCDHARTLP